MDEKTDQALIDRLAALEKHLGINQPEKPEPTQAESRHAHRQARNDKLAQRKRS